MIGELTERIVRRTAGADAARWVRRRRVTIGTTTYGVRLVLRGWHRRPPEVRTTQQVVRESYEGHYTRSLVDHRDPQLRPVVRGRRIAHASCQDIDAGHLDSHLRTLGPILDALEAPVVLEVGGGYGRTLLPFAYARPDATFIGVEPTLAGPRLSLQYRAERADEIAAIAAAAGADRPGPPSATIFCGDGRRMPLADRSVDVSYTNLVLEQIPHLDDVRSVLLEMARVTRHRCGFLEPWDDAQTVFTRAHLRKVAYLAAGSGVLSELGFRDVRVEPLSFRHNPRFHLAYVSATPPDGTRPTYT